MAPRYYHVLPFLTISVKYIQPSLRNSVDKKGKKKKRKKKYCNYYIEEMQKKAKK